MSNYLILYIMKKVILLLVLAVALVPQFAFAEDSTATTTDVTAAPQPSETTGKHNTEFMQAKQQYLQQKEEAMKNLQTQHLETRQTIANLRPTIEAERMLMKEKFQQEKDAFKQKLDQLKDDKKKAIAERVDTKLAAINKRRTDQMTDNLNKLVTILNKIKTKRDATSAAGKDVTSLNSAITAAESAIALSQGAVTTQAGKVYTATVTDPTTLRQAMGTVTKQLEADLLATHKTVLDAKTALYASAKALWALTGGPTPEAPTPTTEAQVTPSAVPTP